jgi:hypothetical protein
MIFRLGSVSSVPIVLCLLASCATVEPSKNEPDPRLDKVLSGVDQCLANQQQATEQLQNQAQQLQLQLQQMKAMKEQLEDTRKAGVANAAPARVDCPKPPKTSSAQVVGYTEQVWIPDLQATLPALIDTSIETSSLDVQHLEEFERDGKRWVRFTVLDSATGRPISLEHKLNRTVGNANSDDATSRHPVIRMGIVVGHINQTADFVLYQRAHKTYQVKLGRNILQDVMVVDVSKQNIAPYVPPEKPAGDKGDVQ